MDARSWWIVVAVVAVVAGVWWFIRRGAGAGLTTAGAVAPPQYDSGIVVDRGPVPPPETTAPNRVYALTVRGTAAGPAATSATYMDPGSTRGAQPTTTTTKPYVKPGFGNAAFLTSMGSAHA